MEARNAVREIRKTPCNPIVASVAVAALILAGLTGTTQAGTLSGGKAMAGSKSPSNQGAWLLAPQIGKIGPGAYVPKPCTPVCL
jgi:hypothetical protein